MESLERVAMEIQQRPGYQEQLAPPIARFDSLRDDWVKGADVLVRLVLRSAQGKVILQGFPHQWIPVFIQFGVCFADVSAPTEYVAVASDLSPHELELLSKRAHARGALREMVEAFASLDPLIADVLHKLDRRMATPETVAPLRIKLTGWQSYGRPEILALGNLIADSACAHHKTAVLLPCARRRPYQSSKTHRRIWGKLKLKGIEPMHVDRLVVSSIGIIPESHWDHPVVLAYDSGVPDI
jgi:predicted RNA-binding protein